MRDQLVVGAAICVWSVSAAVAQAPPQLWVQQFGTPLTDGATGAAVDSTGGVYVTGWTRGSLGGPISGGPDAFVARYTDAGVRVWARQFGSISWDQPNAISADGSGGVFVAGYTGGSLGGPSAGFDDAIVARYDIAGNLLWVRQLGTSGTDEAKALASDGMGGVFVTGDSNGHLGGNDPLDWVFLARYDAAGTQLWLRQFGISGARFAGALAPDGAGGFFFAGMTGGTIARPNPMPGRLDVILARLTSAGERLWVGQFGSALDDSAHALIPDGAGGVYVGGDTVGDLAAPNAGDNDAFLARFDGDGNQIWARQFGTAAFDFINALAPAPDGGVFFAGDNDSHAFTNDAFIGRYDRDGVRLWMRQLGTPSRDLAAGLAPDGAGGVYLAGSTQGSLGGPNLGDDDIYLARFGGSCYPNCDGSTAPSALNVGDFVCFMRFFAAADPYANCDNSTLPPVLNVADFVCFQERFAAGCP